MNVNLNDNVKKVEIEIINQSNPILISIPSSKQMVGIEVEQFFYRPSTTANHAPLLGIVVEGARGRYNENGQQVETLKTIPFRSNNYDFESSESDITPFTGSPQSFNIGFVNKNVISLNPTKIVFDTKYLLVLNLYYV